MKASLTRILTLIGLTMALCGAPADAAEQSPASQTVHQDLRALRDRLVAAVNGKNVDALLVELDPEVRLTTMDNVASIGLDAAKAYYARMMTGANRVVEDMSVSAEPDDLSLLYADNRVAVSAGASKAHFSIVGGKTFEAPLRWTATLVNKDGKWKIAAAHFSANMFDNPILAGMQTFGYLLAGGAAVAGTIIGWLIGRRSA